MTHTTHSADKLHEALALLNEAAKEKREEVQRLIAEKYTDLTSVLGDAAQASGHWLKKEGNLVADTAKEAASTADESVRKHPFYYIGGAAAVALILGLLLLLGRKR